jgi:hypothetical protein
VWMQAKARPRIMSRARASSSSRGEGREGKTAMDLYITLGPPAGSGLAANCANRQPRFLDTRLAV